MDTKTTPFARKLMEERARLEVELAHIAHKNPKNPNDWETSSQNLNVLMSDPNEVADTIEAYETTSAIEVQLESELILVNEALSRIEKGDYGRCTICGGPIEEVRLLAYPAARTCKTHMNN